MSIRQEAMDSLRELSKSFYEQFSVKLDVVSGYRSYGRQTTIAA
jgi:LAS superfamily LD-carboxypeptidase LdcB